MTIELDRTPALISSTLLVVALTAVACSDVMDQPSREAHPQPRHSDKLPELRPPFDLPGRTGPHDPFNTSDPAISRLTPDLLKAVQEAAKDAKAVGLPMYVNSGWRSRAEQQELFDEAVGEFDSEDEARKYVATPDTSAHVTGDAVDIGPADAMSWLSRHGSDHGLCQTFANEPWHYELSTSSGGECPEMLPDGSSRS